jgi:hypothetical protein
MSKNLRKVQDMLDGNYKNKIQVGYSKTEKRREVGEKWTDSDGQEWEQKQGYIYKIPTMPSIGIFSKQCKDCKKNCSPKTAKPWDRDTFKTDGRCYYCQLNYEIDLKADKPIRWFAYRRLKDLRNMEAIERDMEQWIDELEKQKNEKVFDNKVANALANGEVEMTINKNTQ